MALIMKVGDSIGPGFTAFNDNQTCRLSISDQSFIRLYTCLFNKGNYEPELFWSYDGNIGSATPKLQLTEHLFGFYNSYSNYNRIIWEANFKEQHGGKKYTEKYPESGLYLQDQCNLVLYGSPILLPNNALFATPRYLSTKTEQDSAVNPFVLQIYIPTCSREIPPGKEIFNNSNQPQHFRDRDGNLSIIPPNGILNIGTQDPNVHVFVDQINLPDPSGKKSADVRQARVYNVSEKRIVVNGTVETGFGLS